MEPKPKNVQLNRTEVQSYQETAASVFKFLRQMFRALGMCTKLEARPLTVELVYHNNQVCRNSQLPSLSHSAVHNTAQRQLSPPQSITWL